MKTILELTVLPDESTAEAHLGHLYSLGLLRHDNQTNRGGLIQEWCYFVGPSELGLRFYVRCNGSRKAIQDENLFRPFVGKNLSTWANWFTALKCLYGLPLKSEAERKLVHQCTGRPASELPMSHCCEARVPHSNSSFRTFGRLLKDWVERLGAGLNRTINMTNQPLGDMEGEVLQQTQGLEHQLLEEASPKKVDQSPPVCPVCGPKLSRLSHGHERTSQTRFGPVTLR